MRLFKVVVFSISLVTSAMAQESVDLNSLMAVWSEKAPPVTRSIQMPDTIPTRLGNVDAPPVSLWGPIFTAIPQNVIVDLMDPAKRASMKSEVAAGNTPEWYATLPPDLKSYLESINAAIATGGTEYTGTEAAPKIPNFTATVGSFGSQAPNNPGDGNAAATSSKGAAPPKATWGAMEVLGVSGAASIFGLAFGL